MSQSTGRSSRAVCERADGRRALSWTDVGIVLLGCAALTAMLFGSAFRESMMPDDPLSIATGRIANERGLAEAHAIFSDLWLRPIPLLHYALCYRLFGMAPDGYRLANALWHLLNTLLVLALAWRFTRSRGLSALAAGMFATHFGHWENAVWLSAVEDLHAGFFTLAALLAYGRFRQRGERTWYAIALAAAMGALLSKEVAVMVAPMLLAADLLAEPSTPAPWQRRLAQAAIRTLPFFAMSVLFASAVLFSGRVEMVAGAGKWDLFGAHVPRNALGYLGWMLWPYETAGELPGVAGSPAAGLFRAVFVVVRLAAAAGVVWLLLRGTPTQRLLVVWLLLAIAPYAFRTAMFSRYCYTMTAFFAVLVARIAHDSHHPNTQDPTPQHPNTPTPQHPLFLRLQAAVLTVIAVNLFLTYASPSVESYRGYARNAHPVIDAVLSREAEMTGTGELWLVDPPAFSPPGQHPRGRMWNQITMLVRRQRPPTRALSWSEWQALSRRGEVPAGAQVYRWRAGRLHRLGP